MGSKLWYLLDIRQEPSMNKWLMSLTPQGSLTMCENNNQIGDEYHYYIECQHFSTKYSWLNYQIILECT
jgi:hypothetical protein